PKQHDRKGWPKLAQVFAEAIKGRTRDEWERVFEGSDAFVAPVLALGEVARPPHNAARKTFVENEGVLQPGPAPRFSRTQSQMGATPSPRGADSEAILRDWGFAATDIAAWKKGGVIGTDSAG